MERWAVGSWVGPSVNAQMLGTSISWAPRCGSPAPSRPGLWVYIVVGGGMEGRGPWRLRRGEGSITASPD